MQGRFRSTDGRTVLLKTELTVTAFIQLCFANVWPHLERAMESKSPILRSNSNHLERIQRFASQLGKGLRRMPYEHANSNSLDAYLLVLTCTCDGIHPGWVEPASQIALTTSWTEAFQTRRPCANSLDTFTQSCLHRECPKTRRPEVGSMFSLIVVAPLM